MLAIATKADEEPISPFRKILEAPVLSSCSIIVGIAG